MKIIFLLLFGRAELLPCKRTFDWSRYGLIYKPNILMKFSPPAAERTKVFFPIQIFSLFWS